MRNSNGWAMEGNRQNALWKSLGPDLPWNKRFPKLREFCVACLTKGVGAFGGLLPVPGCFSEWCHHWDWLMELGLPSEPELCHGCVWETILRLHLSLIKAISFAKSKTIQGTPRVPMGVPGMGNESEARFRAWLHDRVCLERWWRETRTGSIPSVHIPVNFPKANTSDVSSKHRSVRVTNEVGFLCVLEGRGGGSWEWSLVFLFFSFKWTRIREENCKGTKPISGTYCRDRVWHGKKCLVC